MAAAPISSLEFEEGYSARPDDLQKLADRLVAGTSTAISIARLIEQMCVRRARAS